MKGRPVTSYNCDLHGQNLKASQSREFGDLLFADDVVLPAALGYDLQFGLQLSVKQLAPPISRP